ncbi:MAG: hypothetical protein ACI87E_001393 [Mariniblastus sp.]|jgi:hypothetical protein
MSKKFWLLLASVVLILPTQVVVGQDVKTDAAQEADTKQDEGEESLADLVKKTQKSMGELRSEINADMQKLQKSVTDKTELRTKMNERIAEYRESMAALGPDLLAAVKETPKTDEAKEALSFLMSSGLDEKGTAGVLMIKHHSKGDGLLDMAFSNASRPGPNSKKILASIMKSDASEKVKATASYGKIAAAIGEFDGSEKGEAKVERIVKRFVEKAGDAKVRGQSLAKMAELQLFEFMNLRIGKTAPNILGEDVDGEEFKLSDYRGKVVFLDFWGDW